MGYVLSAYVVDQQAIADVLGSRDDTLVSRIVSSNPEEFDDDDDFPAGSRRPTLRAALQQLVADPSAISDDPQYRYAFEELCRFLGKLSFADRFDPRAIGLDQFFDSALPFPVPNPDDFPCLGYLPAGGIEAELRRVDSLPKGNRAESTQELVTAWLRCLKSARRKHCGVAIVYG